MRTTLIVEDRIVRKLKQIAHHLGKPFNVVVNETPQAGLAAGQERSTPERYRVRTVSLGGARSGVDPDEALSLADSLEDEELVKKMECK